MFEKLGTIPASFFSHEGKKLSWLAYFFLFMLCLSFFTPGLVTMPATDRDESSFAQASKQMIETGNYTDIRLQDAPRYKKPIGIYWLQSTAVRLFNPHHLDEIWAYRLPSLAGAMIAVLMTAAIGSLLFNPATGLVAAMMMAGCVLLNVEARLAKTDAALLGSIMIALYGLARAYKQQITTWTIPFVFWTAFACGVLIKGPIILLPILGVLVWLKISDKEIGWFKSLEPMCGMFYALLLITPWFVAISLQSHGAFMQQSAGNDMLAKLWQGQNRGIMPPGLHLLLLPILFFPFSLFIAIALPDIWKGRKDASIKFCLGWIAPTWLVFELSFTKLPHYVLPAYPGLALLAAKFLVDGFPTFSDSQRRFSAALIIGFWVMLGMGFAVAFAWLPNLSDDVWFYSQMGAGLLIVLSQTLSLAAFPKYKMASVSLLLIGSLGFMATTFGSTLPGLKHVWTSRQIVEAAASIAPCANSQLVSLGYHEPSLIFLAGTQTLMANNVSDVVAALKEHPCQIAVVDAKHKIEFLSAFPPVEQQPQEVGVVEGLNTGHGSTALLTLFTRTLVTP